MVHIVRSGWDKDNVYEVWVEGEKITLVQIKNNAVQSQVSFHTSDVPTVQFKGNRGIVAIEKSPFGKIRIDGAYRVQI